MSNAEYWPEQHTVSERLNILKDLEASLRVAQGQEDEAREYYTREAINALNYGN
jgi:hypothetical protein